MLVAADTRNFYSNSVSYYYLKNYIIYSIYYTGKSHPRPLHSIPFNTEISSGLNSKSKTLKFEMIRDLVIDFGITICPR